MRVNMPLASFQEYLSFLCVKNGTSSSSFSSDVHAQGNTSCKANSHHTFSHQLSFPVPSGLRHSSSWVPRRRPRRRTRFTRYTHFSCPSCGGSTSLFPNITLPSEFYMLCDLMMEMQFFTHKGRILMKPKEKPENLNFEGNPNYGFKNLRKGLHQGSQKLLLNPPGK